MDHASSPSAQNAVISGIQKGMDCAHRFMQEMQNKATEEKTLLVDQISELRLELFNKCLCINLVAFRTMPWLSFSLGYPYSVFRVPLRRNLDDHFFAA